MARRRASAPRSSTSRTGRWSYLPNANGFDEARVSDVDRRAETNDFPYLELTAARTGQLPSPSHHYTLQVSPPKSVIGGPKGAVIVTLGAAKTVEGWDSPQSHQFDLATGLWTRASNNLLTEVSPRTPYTDSSASYDPATKRIYVTLHFPTDDRLACLDLNDNTWKSAGRYALPGTNGVARSIWVDEPRRLLLYLLDNNQLWALDLNNVGAGPRRLTTAGAVPNTSRRWELYPASDGGDGCFYTFTGAGPAYDGGTAAARGGAGTAEARAADIGQPARRHVDILDRPDSRRHHRAVRGRSIGRRIPRLAVLLRARPALLRVDSERQRRGGVDQALARHLRRPGARLRARPCGVRSRREAASRPSVRPRPAPGHPSPGTAPCSSLRLFKWPRLVSVIWYGPNNRKTAHPVHRAPSR